MGVHEDVIAKISGATPSALGGNLDITPRQVYCKSEDKVPYRFELENTGDEVIDNTITIGTDASGTEYADATLTGEPVNLQPGESGVYYPDYALVSAILQEGVRYPIEGYTWTQFTFSEEPWIETTASYDGDMSYTLPDGPIDDTQSGEVQVDVPVENQGSLEGTRTLVIGSVDEMGGSRYGRRIYAADTVTVPSSGSKTATMSIPVEEIQDSETELQFRTVSSPIGTVSLGTGDGGGGNGDNGSGEENTSEGLSTKTLGIAGVLVVGGALALSQR